MLVFLWFFYLISFFICDKNVEVCEILLIVEYCLMMFYLNVNKVVLYGGKLYLYNIDFKLVIDLDFVFENEVIIVNGV